MDEKAIPVAVESNSLCPSLRLRADASSRSGSVQGVHATVVFGEVRYWPPSGLPINENVQNGMSKPFLIDGYCATFVFSKRSCFKDKCERL